MNETGPTTVRSESQVCGLCKFHEQHMIHSGENPLYHHYCIHPISLQGAAGQKYPNIEGYAGREIGRSDNTPDWCPVLPHNERKNAGGRELVSTPAPRAEAAHEAAWICFSVNERASALSAGTRRVGRIEGPQHETDAARIVLAVNSRAALVAALEGFVAEHDTAQRAWRLGECTCPLCVAARAALAEGRTK